jgi:phenylpropionate dioxygenase-like ring-hydroxylating dioxygenase large terminal subunit
MPDLNSTADGRPSSLVGRERIAAAVYSEPAIFELEMERLFGRAWLYVGHESQIRNAGDFFTSRLGRRDVIVVRDHDGRVHVLENRCAHRGPHLCGQETGHTKRFVCPYHAWSFKLDGSLIGLPLIEEYGDDFDKGAHSLTRVPAVDSYRGFIFARLTSEGPDLGTFLGPLRRAFDDLLDRSPTGEIEPIAGVIRHRYRANWKLMFENLNDIFHAVFAHASAAAGLREVTDPEKLHRVLRSLVAAPDLLPKFKEFQSNITPHGHSYVSGLISLASRELPRDAHFEALAAAYGEPRAREILSTDLHLVLIYPSCTVNSSQQTIRVVRPISVDETEVIGYCFRLKGVPDEVTRNALAYCNMATSAFSPVVADDLEIYERSQRNLQSTDGPGTYCARALGSHVPPATSEEYIRNQYRVWAAYLEQGPLGSQPREAACVS